MQVTFKHFILSLLLSLNGVFALPADEPTRFTPLSGNERFAFSIRNFEPISGRRNIWSMTLYAVQENNIAAISELFTWEDLIWSSIQFTSDFRRAFFRAENNLAIWSGIQRDPNLFRLYMADGNTGEITLLLSDFNDSSFRASNDGKFILLQRSIWRSGYVTLYLFDVESRAIIAELVWQPPQELVLPDGQSFIEGWAIRRVDNQFQILAEGEIGGILAAALFDPVTLDLQTLWTDFRTLGLFEAPSIYGNWDDDVILQHNDPNIRLQR